MRTQILKRLFASGFACLFYFLSTGQTPHLTGNIFVSVSKGTIRCNLTLSNIPMVKDYCIRLNTGLNIEYLRDSADRTNYSYSKHYDDKKSDESFEYVIEKEDSGKASPSTIIFSYTGAFPVVKDTNKILRDWKGNIACNGNTILASEQSAWYPIIYDRKNDLTIDKYTYNLTVTCDDGKAIYVNGSSPKYGKTNTFKSAKPVALLLFSGNYGFEQLNNIHFINTGLTKEKLSLLSKKTNDITNFYQHKLGIPYGDKVTYLASSTTSKGTAFLFVTYPSVMIVGAKEWNINNLFDSRKPVIDTNWGAYISHELAHYYFGTLFTPNSDLRFPFLEGFTEYLSLQYIRYSLGEKYYHLKQDEYSKSVTQFKEKIPPLSQLTNDELTTSNNRSMGEMYRYRYFPLLLTAIEKEIGADAMWKWISVIIKDKNATTNYAYFKKSLLQSGVNESTLNSIEEKFITSKAAVENVLAAIEK
jgi:hypothetical protein